ncbi:MAG: RNA methyltransferase [Spirochaetales bacterium]|nr:RNA methyltransferase [Spirochaetales bacterium]
MERTEREELIAYLEGFVTENRKSRMARVLDNRTRNLTVVMENIYQSQNASAVLRHCDALGIQDVHIIENSNKWKTNPDVDLGTAQWLTVNRYNREENNTVETLRKLKADGYRIIATSPHPGGYELDEADLSLGKAAIVFGTEMHGISDLVREEADEFLKIPMVGFVESFNISASCAIVLYTLTQKLRALKEDWHLQDEEKREIYFSWLRNSIKNVKQIEERYRLQTP